MSRNEFLFFATPREQASWLQTVLASSDLWCVMWSPKAVTAYNTIQAKQLSETDFTASEEFALQLYLGNRALAPHPIWSGHGSNRGDLDVARSQAIEILPSFMIAADTLLLGQMALLQNQVYRESGIDPKPLKAWFKEITASLAPFNATEFMVTQPTSLGKTKRWEDIFITKDAVAHKRSGKTLKQFPEGTVHFDVEEIGSH
jgi:hypothetical protein